MKAFLTPRYELTQLTLLIFFIIFSLFLPVPSPAKVRGECYKCHTMHNSQNGATVVRTGSNVGWGSDGLEGGSTVNTLPMNQLLKTTCVGCHTSTTTETIYDPTGMKIPIVYNVQEPGQPLAGGNFHWVAKGMSYDAYGHNVNGIAAEDDTLKKINGAPGKNPAGCEGSCHYTLADPPSAENSNRGGCQGCHVFTYHHEDNNVYRFLKGHGVGASLPINPARKNITTYADYVLDGSGWEDDDWEKETSSRHNWYKGTTTAYSSDGTGLRSKKTITAFCSGCHSVFHGPYVIDDETGEGLGMGSSSPWLRHPTDISLYDKGGEYTWYDTVNNYSVQAPVGWVDPNNRTKETAVVMCISCHRPHGSDQPDLLRWDYTGMVAGTQGAGKGKGCFTCHTTKDGN